MPALARSEHLHLIPADFTRELELPPLDGILMANSLHFFRDKEKGVAACWLVFETRWRIACWSNTTWTGAIPGCRTLCRLKLSASWLPEQVLANRVLLAKHPSSFLREFYSAHGTVNRELNKTGCQPRSFVCYEFLNVLLKFLGGNGINIHLPGLHKGCEACQPFPKRIGEGGIGQQARRLPARIH